MTQNKWTCLICFPLSVIALFGAWCIAEGVYVFWSNVLLGVFGSGLLTFVVAAINYCTERRKALENFWTLGHKAARAFGKYPIGGNDAEKIESILIIGEFDYAAFDDAYASIDFLFGNKKRKQKIFAEIYRPVRDAGGIVSVSAFNIIRLRRAIPGNMKILERYISEVDKILITEEKSYVESETGNKIEVTLTSNRMTDLCIERLDNFYWKTMYPRKKHEEEKSE